MFRAILVPLGGSATAGRALPYAARLAASAGGRLVLTRIVAMVGDHASDRQMEIARAQRYLATLADRLVGEGLRADYAIGRGLPVNSILKTASDHNAGCVVMATHGHTGLADLLMGSVAEGVLAHSHVPVLLVNSDRGHPAKTEIFVDIAHMRVLVPLDGSEFAKDALTAAQELLSPGGTLV